MKRTPTNHAHQRDFFIFITFTFAKPAKMNFFKKLFGSKTKNEAAPKPVESTEKMTPSVNPYNSEQKNPYLTNLVQAHNSVTPFNYNLAVVWALSLMKEGNEMPSVLMLASFAEPINSFEIRPYINVALNDLNLKKIEGEEALQYVISYYCSEILGGNRLRNNLRRLIDLYFSYYQQDLGLENLYLLSCAWDDLENGYDNYYYDGAKLNNIESIAKKEAKYWLENH